MQFKPKCELVVESKPFVDVEVLRVHYDITSLDCLTLDLESTSHGEFAIRFESPEGVRVLDEGQLCEFWNQHSSPNGWLWQVLDGGWLALERQRDQFYLEDMTPGTLLEFFIVADQCVSVLTRFPPVFPGDSSASGTVA